MMVLLDNQVMFFLRISREAPRHDVSRGGQIIPSSLEVAKSYHLYLIKITQPLTSLEELRIIPSLLLSRDQNQTIPTSLEGHNHTIHTSLELPQSDHTPLELLNQTIHPPSYKKFWHTCIITPDPPMCQSAKINLYLTRCYPGGGLMLSRGKGVWGARPVAG